MTAKKPLFANRAEFIAYNEKQTKAWLCNALSKETGDDWSSRHDLTAKELATKLAYLQGWSDTTTEVEIENISEDFPTDDVEPEPEAKPVVEKKSIEALLADLKTEATQSGRKKIRVQLRAQGYKLSAQPKAEKAPKKPKVKKASITKKAPVGKTETNAKVAGPTSKLKEATKRAAARNKK